MAGKRDLINYCLNVLCNMLTCSYHTSFPVFDRAASPPRPPGQENAGGLAIFEDDEFQEAAPAQSAPAALFAAGR